MSFCGRCGRGPQAADFVFCPGCGSPAGDSPVALQRAHSQIPGSPNVVRQQPQLFRNLSSLPGNETGRPKDVVRVIDGLKQVYRECILPLEKAYCFESFFSASLTDTDIEALPMILLIGQYSVGKTTFIKYLLQQDFPGSHIGIEPTTAGVMAIMHGPEERLTPGNAVASQPDKPFSGLSKFGVNFLNRFQCSQCPSPILRQMTFIDTPGILSGAKQKEGRQYDFTAVVHWFAERADRVLLLFDANKLDISDNFKEAIQALRGHDDKIRCVLNKADSIRKPALMRVYGALMWALGKVLDTPEVLRVYVGSFWEHPLQEGTDHELFQSEESDLLSDLRSLPRNSTVRRINEILKRARLLRVHVLIVDHLRKQFGMFGREKTQKKLMETLLDQFRVVQSTHGLAKGDFPHLERFRNVMEKFDIKGKFRAVKQRELELLSEALSLRIPALLKQLPAEEQEQASQMGMFQQQAMFGGGVAGGVGAAGTSGPVSAPSAACSAAAMAGEGAGEDEQKQIGAGMELGPGGVVVDYSEPGWWDEDTAGKGAGSNHRKSPSADGYDDSKNPFSVAALGKKGTLWVVDQPSRRRYDAIFYGPELGGIGQGGKARGEQLRPILLKTGLPPAVLAKLWALADMDRDGALDADEFCVAMWLVDSLHSGTIPELPGQLKEAEIPPSKRHLFDF